MRSNRIGDASRFECVHRSAFPQPNTTGADPSTEPGSRPQANTAQPRLRKEFAPANAGGGSFATILAAMGVIAVLAQYAKPFRLVALTGTNTWDPFP